jgi:hypothetical protein
MNATNKTFYKLDIQGIVYLVDPVTSRAYTYDLEDPTEIGSVSWTDPKTDPTIALRHDWLAVMTHKQMVLTNKIAAAHVTQTHAGHDDATTSSDS